MMRQNVVNTNPIIPVQSIGLVKFWTRSPTKIFIFVNLALHVTTQQAPSHILPPGTAARVQASSRANRLEYNLLTRN